MAKWIIIARQLFKRACKWKVIQKNPFSDAKARSQENPSRMHFISRPDAQRVLNACPDDQWRLMFALSRFGGLRVPSGALALKWKDIDFEKDRMTTGSSKTEHRAGAGVRIVPLFPEIRPYLLSVFDQGEAGSQFVITRYRGDRHNLRTQLCCIIKKGGLRSWAKPWHNLRSTRQTELTEEYPIHVVCAWLGNSAAVARAHYLQVRDEHFQKAIQSTAHLTA